MTDNFSILLYKVTRGATVVSSHQTIALAIDGAIQCYSAVLPLLRSQHALCVGGIAVLVVDTKDVADLICNDKPFMPNDGRIIYQCGSF